MADFDIMDIACTIPVSVAGIDFNGGFPFSLAGFFDVGNFNVMNLIPVGGKNNHTVMFSAGQNAVNFYMVNAAVNFIMGGIVGLTDGKISGQWSGLPFLLKGLYRQRYRPT